jgi:hypothetical protein
MDDKSLRPRSIAHRQLLRLFNSVPLLKASEGSAADGDQLRGSSRISTVYTWATHNWPSKLYFYCDVPPGEGGATPLASERRVFPRIPAEIRERFTRHGLRYIRNDGPDVDLPWQEVFQTTDRDRVDAYCRESGTQTVWNGKDGLRTIAIRQAVATHPVTGETVWFNHAHLFHPSTLPAEVVEIMTAEYGVDGLPRDFVYGDGEPIEDEVITLIKQVYDERRDRVSPGSVKMC